MENVGEDTEAERKAEERKEARLEKLQYRREVEEEFTRRQRRLSDLKALRLQLERKLKGVSLKGALLEGNVNKLKISGAFRQSLKERLAKNAKMISEVEKEISDARERLAVVDEELAELSAEQG